MIKKKNYFYLTILSILIFLLYLYINNYFEEKETLKKNINKEEKMVLQNNLITSLSYFSEDLKGNSYIISAEYGVFKKNSSKIEMSKPFAKITLIKNQIITVTSDKAIYDQQNYNTKFEDNVIIQFEDKKINANRMDLDFTSNYINIYDNVIYKDLTQTLYSEFLSLNLTTKDVLVESKIKNKKVNFTTKY